MAFFGFPVVSRAGRIYIFYIKFSAPGKSTDAGIHALPVLGLDDGVTWSSPPVEFR